MARYKKLAAFCLIATLLAVSISCATPPHAGENETGDTQNTAQKAPPPANKQAANKATATGATASKAKGATSDKEAKNTPSAETAKGKPISFAKNRLGTRIIGVGIFGLAACGTIATIILLAKRRKRYEETSA